jgi:hypothetical protein
MTNQTKYTPGPDYVHNPTSPCTCYIEHNGKQEWIVYCSRHSAAFNVIKQLKEAINLLENELDYRPDDEAANKFAEIKAAIAKAEGRDK